MYAMESIHHGLRVQSGFRAAWRETQFGEHDGMPVLSLGQDFRAILPTKVHLQRPPR